MNTSTRAPQVKHLTRCPTVLLRNLTDFYRLSRLVIHHVLTCEALFSRRILSPILKSILSPSIHKGSS